MKISRGADIIIYKEMRIIADFFMINGRATAYRRTFWSTVVSELHSNPQLDEFTQGKLRLARYYAASVSLTVFDLFLSVKRQ
jgi:hypothetical protein